LFTRALFPRLSPGDFPEFVFSIYTISHPAVCADFTKINQPNDLSINPRPGKLPGFTETTKKNYCPTAWPAQVLRSNRLTISRLIFLQILLSHSASLSVHFTHAGLVEPISLRYQSSILSGFRGIKAPAGYPASGVLASHKLAGFVNSRRTVKGFSA
jgi:hypothetical protein